MFLYKYTMCYMKCNPGELHEPAVLFWKHNIHFESWNHNIHMDFILNSHICLIKDGDILNNISCFQHVWCLLEGRKMFCFEGTNKYVYL